VPTILGTDPPVDGPATSTQGQQTSRVDERSLR
jgi:hypothetical protein